MSLKAINTSNLECLGILDLLSQQNSALTSLQEAQEKDSKTIKALTAVSTLYLPASLVVTVFSSNLVQLLPKGSEASPMYFAAAPQSWIPTLIAMGLIALTLMGVKLLEGAFGSFGSRLKTYCLVV